MMGEEVKRVKDEEANKLIKSGWKYCPKSLYKNKDNKATATIPKEDKSVKRVKDSKDNKDSKYSSKAAKKAEEVTLAGLEDKTDTSPKSAGYEKYLAKKKNQKK